MPTSGGGAREAPSHAADAAAPEAGTAGAAEAVSAVCPACSSGATAAWRQARSADPRHTAAAWYALERCRSCGTAWLTTPDRPAESAWLYEEGVYAPRPPRLDALIERLRRIGDRDRLRFFSAFPSGSRIHEIGSGDNRLLAALARAGFRASGSEPSRPYAEAGRRVGLAVGDDAIETLAIEPASLDGIVLWHVLEHLDDPATALARARKWLRSGGRIVLAVPNLSSLQAEIGGDRWFHQDVPRHRVQFTRRGLSLLLERSGFAVERTTTLAIDQSLLGMWQTLLNRVTREPNVLFRALKRQPSTSTGRRRWIDTALTLVAAPLAAAIAIPLELAAAATGRGGSLVVIARPTKSQRR